MQVNKFVEMTGLHLSLERLVTTVALLVLAMSIMPHLFDAEHIPSHSSSEPFGDALSTILMIWAIDLVAISVSIDETSLSLSSVPFVCIFPLALTLAVGDYETFVGIVGLGILTIIFVIARYIANSM
jgi:hypothetical protein